MPGGRGTRGRQLSADEVGKVRRELDAYQRFAALGEQIVEVNEPICEARPAAAGSAATNGADGEKGALPAAPGRVRR